jgi:small subunit ribosomal protein S4
MARYTGPKTKKARRFNEPIFGPSKVLKRKSYPPGQHGRGRRKKQSEYATQLLEKQKTKYTYGVLEKQFRNIFERAARKQGITGVNLLQLLESRLDNTVYRLGLAPTRRGARQMVSHKHILVNGVITNIPSFTVKPGDIISIASKSKGSSFIVDNMAGKQQARFSWLEWDSSQMQGKMVSMPDREEIPENIKEQLIVELYSK